MKNRFALIFILIICLLNLSSCFYHTETPDAPYNYANTFWKSNEPTIFFNVEDNFTCGGKVIIDNVEKNIKFNFEFYSNDVHITDEFNSKLLSAKFYFNGNEFKLYNIYDDELFNGLYSCIIFFKK